MTTIPRPGLALVLAMALAATPALARSTQVVTPSGTPRRCIPLNQIERSEVKDDRTIDFHMLGHTVYRNSLPERCPQLGFERRFGYDTSLNSLCDTDIITVLIDSPPMRGTSCGLGNFQPVTLSKR